MRYAKAEKKEKMDQVIYWKVYESKNANGEYTKTTLTELESVMKEIVTGISPNLEYEVEDSFFGFPCVDFPTTTPQSDYIRVRDELTKRGYMPY